MESGPVFGAPPSVGVTLDAEAVRILTEPELPTLEDTVTTGPALEFLIPSRTRVVVWKPNARQRVGFAGVPMLAGLLTLAVIALLLRVTRTLREGDPFIAINARRLYMIAALVGIGGQVTAFLSAWVRLDVLHHPNVAPYVIRDADMTFVPLIAGLGVAVAAEVFRQGARLRDEVEGLV